MANLIIKPTSGGSLILQDEGGSAAISVAAAGTTTFAENTTLSGTANNIGTVTTATFGSAVVGAQGGTGAFQARVSTGNWVAYAVNAVIPFNDASTGESHDTDSNYDTTNYRYVCPGAGVYYFWMSLYTAQGDTANGFHFRKNETEMNTTVDGANMFLYMENEAYDHTLTGSMIITCAASDRIAVYAEQASDVYTGHASWGGCRLR